MFVWDDMREGPVPALILFDQVGDLAGGVVGGFVSGLNEEVAVLRGFADAEVEDPLVARFKT